MQVSELCGSVNSHPANTGMNQHPGPGRRDSQYPEAILVISMFPRDIFSLVRSEFELYTNFVSVIAVALSGVCLTSLDMFGDSPYCPWSSGILLPVVLRYHDFSILTQVGLGMFPGWAVTVREHSRTCVLAGNWKHFC